MRKGKVYKKFLSCILAAAVVVTSGVVYPGNGKTAAAAGIEASFEDDAHNEWYIIEGEEGVLLDSQGIRYRLNQNGLTATVCDFGYSGSDGPIQSDIVEISATVPISYIDYMKYSQNGKDKVPLGATNRQSSKVTAIEANAFLGSSTLKEVTVPESVISIGDKAFAACPELTKLNWQVTDAQQTIQIGDNTDWSKAEILEGSPKCVLLSENTTVSKYAQGKGYDVPREEASPNPSGSETPSEEPSATPSSEPSTAPSNVPSVEPSAVPSVAPSKEPSTVPSIAPSKVPTATPVSTPVVPTPAVATPAAPTATPKVTGHPALPVVVPSRAPATIPPVVQTPEPTVIPATPAPTAAPTEAVTTPAPASQAPTVTEMPAITVVPAITEVPTVTTAPEKPSEATLVPVQPTIAPVSEKVVVKDNVSYEVNQSAKSVSVSNMNNVKTGNVTVPSTVKINGVSYKVTGVDKNAFKNNTKIKTVQLGKNVTKIEAGAFQGCKNLTSVKLPSKLKTISKNSFKGCSSLKAVKLPKTVTKIGEASFKDCTSLKTVSIGDNPNKKTGGLLFDESRIRYGASTVTIDIGAKAFENCKKLNKVIINALVKIIGKSAFKDCKSLRSVLIYSKVLKKVKGGALTGVHNCKISVPAKKVAPYKVLFKNKGQGKKVVVAKL